MSNTSAENFSTKNGAAHDFGSKPLTSEEAPGNSKSSFKDQAMQFESDMLQTGKDYVKSGKAYVKENPITGVVYATLAGLAFGSLVTIAVSAMRGRR
jgi:hypothetical protein